MFFPILLLYSLLCQDILTESIRYYPILKEIPEAEVSPFRGEPFMFEVTQPFVNLDGRILSFFDISNKGKIPFPADFNYHSLLQNITFEENAMCSPYLAQNLSITFLPSPTSLFYMKSFPVYLTLKGSNKKVPFSQIRLFREKEERENMQFTFGRNITRFGRFNIAADYLEESAQTRRSIGLDTDITLPFKISSRFLFLNVKDEITADPFEDKFLCFMVSRREGIISFFKRTLSGKEETGISSDIYLRLPYQVITVGFDYPDLNSSHYQVLLIDRFNPIPLLYIVPRIVFDTNQEYSVSLGSGYHPLVDLFLYGNVLYDKDNTVHSSFGLRKRSKKYRFESFIFSRNKETRDHSGFVLFYNGEVFSHFHLSSLIVTKLKGEPSIYIQPFYERPFKKGKLTPGIFSGVECNGDETTVNSGITINIIDVSLYFIFDDININEKRSYRFGFQWNFYN